MIALICRMMFVPFGTVNVSALPRASVTISVSSMESLSNSSTVYVLAPSSHSWTGAVGMYTPTWVATSSPSSSFVNTVIRTREFNQSTLSPRSDMSMAPEEWMDAFDDQARLPPFTPFRSPISSSFRSITSNRNRVSRAPFTPRMEGRSTRYSSPVSSFMRHSPSTGSR